MTTETTITDDLAEAKLLPCPFCGAEAERHDFGPDEPYGNSNGSFIACHGCGAASAVMFEFRESLYSNWNRRVAPASPAPDRAVSEELRTLQRAVFKVQCGADKTGKSPREFFSEQERQAWWNAVAEQVGAVTTALSASPASAGGEATLGRFGHHPNPAIDFCVEVEELMAVGTDRKLGVANPEDSTLERRVARAMVFRVGGDPSAVDAKVELRALNAMFSPVPASAGE